MTDENNNEQPAPNPALRNAPPPFHASEPQPSSDPQPSNQPPTSTNDSPPEAAAPATPDATPPAPQPFASISEPQETAPAAAVTPPPSDDRPLFGIGSLVGHPSFGTGRIIGYEGRSYVIAFKNDDVKRLSFNFELACQKLEGDPELDLLKTAVREVLGENGWIDCEIDMGTRWHGGSLILKPGKSDTQEKEIPMDVFFKKLIGVREKLRVLEQKVNNHPSLSNEEKMELQTYLTRSYGSLTTFNVLFKSKENGFVGQRPDGE